MLANKVFTFSSFSAGLPIAFPQKLLVVLSECFSKARTAFEICELYNSCYAHK